MDLGRMTLAVARPTMPAQRGATAGGGAGDRVVLGVAGAAADRAAGGAADGAADDLAAALARGDLSVHLQPEVTLSAGSGRRVVGVEALLRWEHPSRGVLVAGDLLPVAARAGLHRALADAALDLALGGAARWWSHRSPLPVAVNLVAADLRDPTLEARVLAALVRHGLPPRALTVEVGEDTLAGTDDVTVRVLAALRAAGVAVTVDDYGSGPGPLTLLRALSADTLKLDPALVAGVGTDVRTATIVRHTAALAHALGLRVVAGGVRDGATLEVLAVLGCDAAVGPAVAAPMPVDRFVHWLRRGPGDLRPTASLAVHA